MNLIKALQSVKAGRKITREAWNNDMIYVAIQADLLMIKMEDNIFHPWTVGVNDIFADDWQIIESN